jgi:hypothetical protein
MSDLEQDLQQLSAQYDAELQAIVTIPEEVEPSSVTVVEENESKESDAGSDLEQLQSQYDQLLKTKDEFERIIKHQMCMIRFMGDTAESVGIDFRDFPQGHYFNGNN